MYIKSRNLFSQVFPSPSSSLYSSSLLSFFHSSSNTLTSASSGPGPDLIYHEPLPPGQASSPPPPPEPPPPPPLPARNNLLVPATTEHSIIYSLDSNYPRLRINVPISNGYSSLESKLSSGPSKLRALIGRRPSLPGRIVTHEVNIARQTPQSEAESLVIETQEYVRDITRRRRNIHATLMRERTPGERLRRMLGLRIETKLVKVLSTRKSRRGSRKRLKKSLSQKSRRSSVSSHDQSKLFSKNRRFAPGNFFRRLTRKISPQRKSRPRKYLLDFEKSSGSSSECSCPSRSPTPRFIVDRQGAIRWPPIKLSDADQAQDQDTDDGEQRDGVPGLLGHVGIENFTLKNPLSTTESSSDPLRVLGWLQVNTDSHVFTPALARTADADSKAGPFRKAPFHSNMHVLQTKI